MIEPRFEHRRSMLLGGLRRSHRFEDCAAAIPQQWKDFLSMLPFPGQVGKTMYGAVGSASEGVLDYMAAVEVSTFEELPAGIGRMRVPEQRYAVFTHEGSIAGLRKTWDAIWQEWLPSSGMTPANTPDFELYDERYDATTGSGVVEIWFPIADMG